MATAAAKTKAPASAPLVLEFTFEKDTPGTNRFKEDNVPEGERGAIGTLYITKKAVAKMTNTRRIRVTIEGIG